MPSHAIAHVQKNGQDMIIVPVNDNFGRSPTTEQQAFIRDLQARAVSAGLAGTVVPCLEQGSHRTSGFVRFLQGDFTGDTYILTPMLKAMMRHLLKSAGHDVTTFDDATETQEDRTISSLFDQMRPELDGILGAALTTDLESVFLKKPGPCLRHVLAHGLLHDESPFEPDAIYGCWLILRICLLPLAPHRQTLDAPADWLAPPCIKEG